MAGFMILIRIFAGLLMASGFCTVAGAIQNSNRPLADTIGYTGLIVSFLVAVFPYTTVRRFFSCLMERSISIVQERWQPEIVGFDCRGCMGTDWVEKWRGHIVGEVNKKLPGTGLHGARYYIVETTDAVRLEVYSAYCTAGTADMARFTDNPDESLVGKMVYTS